MKDAIVYSANHGLYTFKKVDASSRTFYDIDILLSSKPSLLQGIVLDNNNLSKYKTIKKNKALSPGKARGRSPIKYPEVMSDYKIGID